MSNTQRLSRWRWLALIAIFAMIAAACGSGDDASDDGDDGGDTTAATEAPDTTEAPDEPADEPADEPDEPADEPAAGGPEGTITYAIFEDITTDSTWAWYDTENSVWNAYLLNPTVPSLYGVQFPNYTVVPGIAADAEPPLGAADGDTWVIDVPIQDGLMWSDGEAMDANDVAFTVNTAFDLGLGGNFLAAFPAQSEDDPETADVDETADGIISVEAVDDLTVRFTWSRQPGLSEWQFGALQGPIFPEHFWADHVAASASGEDLYAISGEGAPSGGPTVYAGREAGAFARTAANPNFYDAGSQITVYSSGGVESSGGGGFTVGDTSGEVVADYTEGPNFGEFTYSIYETQDAAVLAMADGEADYLLSSLGLQRGLQTLVLETPNLDIITNEANGFRYLSFNTRKFPMNDSSFRQAIACMIDKEFMATNVLQGVAIPSNSLVPPGNAFWANPDIEAWCQGQTQEERVASSIQILKDGGFTWDVEPEWNADNLDVIPKGEGLRGPDGTAVQELSLLAPGPGYDPLRATYSLFIEDWANDLGIPVTAEPTGFNVIVDEVFATGDAALEWDMYILGWGLTIYPDHVESFFTTPNDSANGGFNTPGYSNPDYDALGEQLLAETDINAAAEIVKEMDAIIAQDVPYVVLFTTPILEAYSNSLQFPATSVLDGIQGFNGLTGSVLVSD